MHYIGVTHAKGLVMRSIVASISVAAFVHLECSAQSMPFPLPGLGGALQSSLKKATTNATNFAGELAGYVSNPSPAQLKAVSQFANFLEQMSQVDLSDSAAVAAAARLGARAGQCLVLQLGTPTAASVARSLEASMSVGQASTYASVNQRINKTFGSLSSRQPCDL